MRSSTARIEIPAVSARKNLDYLRWASGSQDPGGCGKVWATQLERGYLQRLTARPWLMRRLSVDTQADRM